MEIKKKFVIVEKQFVIDAIEYIKLNRFTDEFIGHNIKERWNLDKISKALNDLVPRQIEYWAKLGKLLEENPDFHVFIKDILLAKEEVADDKLEVFVA